MSIYAWKGIQNNVMSSGEIEASSLENAKMTLRDMRVIVTGLEELSGKQAANSNKKLAKAQKAEAKQLSPEEKKARKAEKPANMKYNPRKIKNKQKMMFTKKFGTMVAAGLPILKTLEMLEQQSDNPHLKKVVHQIYKKVESGTTLSEAFAEHPKVFDTVYINLLRAGETSGKLTFFLKRLTVQLEKTEKIRSKVKGALMYPTILLCVAVAVIAIMLIKVVPVFQRMFGSMGNELPGPTQLIVTISEFLRNPSQGGVMVLAILGAFLMFRYLVRSRPKMRYWWHGKLLRMPLVKDIVMKSTLAKIAMIQGNLSAAGVSVLESLDIIRKSVRNVRYKEVLDEVKKGVAAGRPLSEIYAEHEPIIPQSFSQMLAVGEETGSMDDMFDTVAKYYEEEFDTVVDRLTELLEPAMIVFMGTTIGFIIIAMYMPIFNVGQAVSAG